MGLVGVVVDSHCVRDEWAYLVPAACLAFRPEPGGEMGGWTGENKGKYSYGKYIIKHNTMPSYRELQAQDTHASNQNALGEDSEIKLTKPKHMF